MSQRGTGVVASSEHTLYPDDCDATGRPRYAALAGLLERALWEHLGRPAVRGPGSLGVWPVIRKATVEVQSVVNLPQDLRIEFTPGTVGRTSLTLRHAIRSADGKTVAEGELTMDCLNESGEPAPVPAAMQEAFGRRPSVRASETQHLAVRGLAVALDMQGDGRPILFIHGFPLDRTVWRQVMSTLTGWRRIAPDLRGMGLSDAPGRYTMAEYADDLAALLDALHADQAVVCGLSMGGYIAFELFRRHRDRVRGLVLVNTRAEADGTEARAGRDATIARVQRDGLGALADVMVPKLLSPWSVTSVPHVVEQVRNMVTGSPIAGVVGALGAMRDRADSTELLKDIDVPTLVIAGREDALIPITASRSMAEAIPGALLTVIPDAGHLTPLEQPIPTSRVIAEFLEAIH